jgi:hypothetical protein
MTYLKKLLSLETIAKGDMIGLVKVALPNDNSISNVYLVETLGYNCLFTNESATVFGGEDSSIAFTGRLKGKVYLVDFSKEKVELETCLVAKSDLSCLWHRRLAHVGMRNLAKLQKGEHILELINVVFEKDRLCSVC